MWKVLLVEDETFVRESVKEIIRWEDMGFTLAGEASNGLEALPMIKQDPPDLVLCDICHAADGRINATSGNKEGWHPIQICHADMYG